MNQNLTLGDIMILKNLVKIEAQNLPIASDYLLDLLDKLNFLSSQELHRINYEAKILASKN